MVTVDGGPGQRAVHLNAATIAATFSALGILVYLVGFVSGYWVLSQSVSDLKSGNLAMLARLDKLDERFATWDSRLTRVEAQTEFAAQGIAELKLKAGTNR